MVGSDYKDGYPFGSTDKPYPDTGRLVTAKGEIITYSSNEDRYYLSPQRVPAKK